ncbi:MAG TPA: o-succinylbenzoate synthase [Thermoanaerobaculia bacterium]|nr:o-succinylbenzoate synthase [Thermoanaerobaculia bacterium]
MHVESAILRHVEMPLKFRFKTSFGETTTKSFLLLELLSGGLSGFGECVAEAGPYYSPETVGTAGHVLSEFLLPLVVGREVGSPGEFDARAARVRGHRMAKATVETALRDLFAKAAGRSLSAALGGTRAAIEVGVSLGISPTVAETVENVRKHVAAGYRRIKLKIEPGTDVERVKAVREAFPSIALTVDANAAYTLATADRIRALDPFGLDYVEQPLHHEDLADHAELAKTLKTPICLDESIRSAEDARTAIALGACRVINVKIGRVGGHGEALRIHEVARRAGVPLWCGGMLEAGVGRAQNVAVASLPGFSKPGDTSSSSRYFEEDIVEPPLEAADGLMPVPAGPGIGVTVLRDVLEKMTVARKEFRA